MNKQGQTSVEFLLIILIILIYLQTYIQPAISKVTYATEDTKRVGMVVLAAEKLANSVNKVSLMGADAKDTLHLIMPPESKLFCDNGVSGIVGLSEGSCVEGEECLLDGLPDKCNKDSGTCQIDIGLLNGVSPICQTIENTGETIAEITVSVEKKGVNVNVSVE